MNIYIETFGCTFNKADSQIMAGLLQEDHANIVSTPFDADVIIINTCYVKYPTEQKVINRIHEIQRQLPQKKLIIAGCMVEIDQDKLKKAAPNAGWIGPHRIKSTPDVVKSTLNGEIVRVSGFRDDMKVCLPKVRFNPFIHIIQICEGCIRECSYCCTRFARGRLQSYPIDMIRCEAEEAIADGCVELQLTAQDTAAYGKDTGETLSELIENITGLDGTFRVRIGMMHPKSMMDDLDNIIDVFRDEKVYKFLHIPLQSGNDNVLRDMNRGYSVDEFMDIIKRFRAEIPEISIATDVIVGYPTENEEAFFDTFNVIEDIKPDFLHISKYRHRPKAKSSSMDELDYNTIKKRSKLLNDLKSEITYQNNLKLIGTTQKVLITEKGRKGGYIGRTDSYKPIIVENDQIGSFVNVKIQNATSTYSRGFVV